MRESLHRQRWAAELDRNDLALTLGQHAGLLAELSTAAAAHPLDERLAGQLILALYRSGRQADALAHYQRLRRHLADELGADPNPGLQQLHRQILRADPGLAIPSHSAGPAPAAGIVVRQAVPRDTSSFTGRDEELAWLVESHFHRD